MMLPTTMKILHDPNGVQAKLNEASKRQEEELKALRIKEEQKWAQAEAAKAETMPDSPLTTKVTVHQTVEYVETAPGVMMHVLPGGEQPGPTKVTIHGPGASDLPDRPLLGTTHMRILDDPQARQGALQAQRGPIEEEEPKSGPKSRPKSGPKSEPKSGKVKASKAKKAAKKATKKATVTKRSRR